MARKVTKKYFTGLNPSEIGKMRAPELRNLLRGARQMYNAQAKTFKRYEKSVYSPAYDKMKTYYEEIGTKAPSKMNMNQMRSELFRLQEFFDSDTATVPGARKVQAEQDRRIFGVDKRGRPKYRMNVEERKEFWSVFEEYKKMRPADVYEQSNIVQQSLGQMLVESGRIDFSANTLGKLADLVGEIRSTAWEMNVDYDEDDSVLSGERIY